MSLCNLNKCNNINVNPLERRCILKLDHDANSICSHRLFSECHRPHFSFFASLMSSLPAYFFQDGIITKKLWLVTQDGHMHVLHVSGILLWNYLGDCIYTGGALTVIKCFCNINTSNKQGFRKLFSWLFIKFTNNIETFLQLKEPINCKMIKCKINIKNIEKDKIKITVVVVW